MPFHPFVTAMGTTSSAPSRDSRGELRQRAATQAAAPRYNLPPGYANAPPPFNQAPRYYGQTAPPFDATTNPSSVVPATERTTRTTTIRNHVNLKKDSLVLLPDPETPGGLLVRFVFDANLPCYLSAFLVATDAPREGSRLALTDGRQVQTRRVKKLAGLGQTGEVSVSKLDADTLKKYLAENRTGADSSDDSLTNPTHALIVRLECVVPASTAVDGTADTDPVSVLEPAAPTGSALTATSQAQTTFSKVAFADPGSDKAFVTSVTKQKIWVDSVSYELQEIFGIEHCTAGTPLGENGIGDGDGDDAGKECVVCMSEPRDTTALPCRHMCMCGACARMLRGQSNRCPICRTPVESLLEIKVATKQGE